MSTTTISHYEILAPVGEGGMGVVYRAVDTRLGRAVAVKLLRQDGAIDANRRKRFVHEARAASALNHPNIVTIHDIGCEGGVDFIAMEYIAGLSLAQLIARGRIAVPECLRLATQIADALAAAHAAGIFHRDLKPANIMVTETGSIKVLDFGLAKLAEVAEPESMDERIATRTALPLSDLHTEVGTILGTAAYMSPEQAEGRAADARSDVFSFGAVLYEMVTGQRAFDGSTKVATLGAVLTRDPDPPSHLVPGLPSDLEKTIGRCLRKSPERRWQSMSDLKVALEDLREEVESGGIERAGSAAGRRRSRAVRLALAASMVAVAGLGTWWAASRTPVREPATPFLTRLTSDVGWTDYPAISFDGRMLAYASDRSGEGNLDIWVQHVPDGAPVRLTRDPDDEVDPTFTADGSGVAFQSNRRGGGIYLVPTLGGEERLVVARGFSPRFSPDGKWLAYGLAEQGGSHIYVSPATGGPATPIAPGFHRTQAPVWSPDGRRLLFWGQRTRDAAADGNVDWYVTDVPGGSVSPTEARRVLSRQQFEAFLDLPLPDAWAGGDRILFHGTVGDSSNMWQVPVSSRGWPITGSPQRVTFGTTDEAAASVTADGKMVFISRTRGADIWSLPIDAERGKVEGSMQRVTQDAADDYDPSVSADGSSVVFRSRRAGRFAVVLKKAGSSAETVLARAPADHYAAINREGTKVAYSFQQDGRMPVFVVGVSGGAPERVCDDCGEVKEWLPGGDGILYVTQRDPSSIGRLMFGRPPDGGWVSHRSYGIYSPRMSSDGAWIAFNSRTDRLAPARVVIARIEGPAVAREEDWIEVSKDGDAPSWSPAGTLLYFWSDRDGSPCLWGQRLDPATGRPLGAPLSIQHFHSRGLSWKNLYFGPPGLAVTHDRIVFNLGEHTGNIWMTELPAVK